MTTSRKRRGHKDSRLDEPKDFGRSASTPTAVESILNSALKVHGLDQKIARYNFVMKWPEIVGEDISKRTRPECIRGKTLIVRVIDSVWAQELSFYKETILRRLRKHLPEDQMLDDVMFVVGDLRE